MSFFDYYLRLRVISPFCKRSMLNFILTLFNWLSKVNFMRRWKLHNLSWNFLNILLNWWMILINSNWNRFWISFRNWEGKLNLRHWHFVLNWVLNSLVMRDVIDWLLKMIVLGLRLRLNLTEIGRRVDSWILGAENWWLVNWSHWRRDNYLRRMSLRLVRSVSWVVCTIDALFVLSTWSSFSRDVLFHFWMWLVLFQGHDWFEVIGNSDVELTK